MALLYTFLVLFAGAMLVFGYGSQYGYSGYEGGYSYEDYNYDDYNHEDNNYEDYSHEWQVHAYQDEYYINEDIQYPYNNYGHFGEDAYQDNHPPDSGYDGYSPYHYGYIENEGFYSYTYEGNEHGGYISYDYAYEYDYEEGYPTDSGYAGDAPGMYHYDGYVYITIDNDGNITINPPEMDNGAIWDGGHIYIRLPSFVDPLNVRVALPGYWTYASGHDTVQAVGFNEHVEEEYQTYKDYTVVTVTRPLDDAYPTGGYVGFQPLSLPAGANVITVTVTNMIALQNTMNAVNTHFPTPNANNFLVIRASSFAFAGTITLSQANATVVFTGNNTNVTPGVNPSFGQPLSERAHFPQNNNARHFNVTNGAHLMLVNVIIDGRNAASVAPPPGTFRGGLTVNGSRLTMHVNTVVAFCRANNDGGGLGLINSSTFNMYDGTFHDNFAEGPIADGGAIRVFNQSTFTMRGGALDNNHAARLGGGAWAADRGTINIMGTAQVLNNTSGSAGGGVGGVGAVGLYTDLTRGSTVNISGGTIRNNTGTQGGGGVFMQFASNLNISGGLIETNTTQGGAGGGGVLIGHHITATMTAGTIRNNAAGSGGGIHVNDNSTLTMSGGIIYNNRFHSRNAAGVGQGVVGTGGGVHVASASTFTMRGGMVGHATILAQGNLAVSGGGVWVGGSGSQFIMEQGGTSPNFTNGSIFNNQATNGGGVFANNATITMSNNARIHNNLATSSHIATGGGGTAASPIAIVGANPGPSGNGGGIHATNTNITMNNTARIDHNRTSTSFTNQARPNGLPAVQPPPSTAIPGAPILTPNFYNHANGGGIFITGSGSTLTMNHSIRIDSNSTAASLGNAGTTVGGQVLGGFEIRPTVVANGGGIFASGGAVVQITAGAPDVQIHGNNTSSIITNVYNPTVTMTNPATGLLYTREEIVARRRLNMPITTGSGAGAFVYGATFHMPTGRIHGNVANASANAGGGAGVYVHSGGTFNMSVNAIIGADSFAQGNRIYAGSGGQGGGVFVNGSTFHMNNDARISFNRVAIPQAPGGGMNVTGNSTVTMAGNTRIRNNIGGLQGGGVHMAGGNFTMSGNAVIETNHVLAGNSGGGVHLGGGVFSMTSANNHIRNHSFGVAADILTITNQYIRFGAGVQVTGTGHFRLLAGSINNNRARQHGAGVRVFGNGRFDMHGGEITNNHILPDFNPSGGAGVFVETAAPAPPTMVGFNMMNGRIHNNSVLAPTAATHNNNRGGGGVRVNSGFFRQNGGQIENNVVLNPGVGTNVGGGGVFMAGGTYYMGHMAITAATPPSGATYGNGTGGVIRGHDQTPVIERGGGVFIMGTATFNLGGGTNVGGDIYNNIANNGGGIYVTGANARLNIGAGGLVETNRAQFGGGVNINSSIVNMTGGEIRDNRNQPTTTNPITEGGGVRVTGSSASFTMTGGTIGHATNAADANRALRGGGVWVGNNATFNMNTPTGGGLGGQIVRNSSAGTVPNLDQGELYGGGVFVTSNGTFNMAYGIIEHNWAHRGGGVAAWTNGTFNMSGGIIRNHVSEGSGGGVIIRFGSLFDMSGTALIENNHANLTNTGAHGGGVHMADAAGVTAANASSFYMSENARINNNRAGGNGGGISLGSTGFFHMSGGIIENNRATTVGNGATLMNMLGGTMSGGEIRNNRYTPTDGVVSAGGGMWIGGSVTFTMTGGTIGHATDNAQGNRAVNGGGVWVGSGATFHMQAPIGGGAGGQISRNSIVQTAHMGGGGVRVDNGIFIMASGSVRHNDAPDATWGGGVCIVNGGNFTMSGGEIYSNAAESGGGVGLRHATSIFTMTGGTIRNNASRQAGTQNGAGGGMRISYGATFNMQTGAVIRNNTANAGGAGIFAGHTNIHPGGTANLTMHGGIIENNTVVYGAWGGGGVMMSIGNFTMHDGIIRNNAAPFGGGVNLTSHQTTGAPAGNAVFNMHGGQIYNNRYAGRNAAGDGVGNITEGGGVRVNSARSVFTMTGGVIGGNIPAHANTAGNGGGVWVGNAASFNMLPGVNDDGELTYGRIMGNAATNSAGLINGGGGVHVVGLGSEFTMRAGVIGGDAGNGEGNTAVRGGGVHVSGPAIFRMEAGSVTLGGMPITTHGHVSGNTATGPTASDGGGGIFMFHQVTLPNLTHRAQFFLEAGIVGGNSNDDEGNKGQHGGGIFVHSSATVTMSGGRIAGNEAIACGGGINLGANIHDNNLIMTGGIIGGDIEGEGNIAGTDGGGVRVGINSAFEMDDGRIIGNEAVNGGGVVVLTDSIFNMRGGSVGSADNPDEGNTAVTGGGVSVGLGWIEGIATATSFNMYGGTIGNNSADFGGGVYVNDNVNGNVFNLRGTDAKIITANEAEYDGGGVWVAEFAEMRMQITAPAATNVSITHNKAGRMGGGIFTERHEYASPLTRFPGSPLLGAQTVAYSNLVLRDVTFNNNSANRRYVPPVNATAVLAAALPDRAFLSTSQPANPVPIRVHPLNNFDINFHVPGVLFEFHKTNSQIFEDPRVAVLLPNAQFRLFRADTEDLGGTGLGGLVPGNIAGTPWEEVVDPDIVQNMLSTNLNNEPISFYMTPGFIYQLVEVMAPSGYQIPSGQWQLRVCEVNPPEILFTVIGDPSTPRFIPNDFSSIDIDWFLGNRQDFRLPLTGGAGMPILIIASGTMLVAASGATAMLAKRRRDMSKTGCFTRDGRRYRFRKLY